MGEYMLRDGTKSKKHRHLDIILFLINDNVEFIFLSDNKLK